MTATDIKPGDIVQTSLYGRSDYIGTQVRIDDIQMDVEPDQCLITATNVLKSGGAGKRTLRFKPEKIIEED